MHKKITMQVRSVKSKPLKSNSINDLLQARKFWAEFKKNWPQNFIASNMAPPV